MLGTQVFDFSYLQNISFPTPTDFEIYNFGL